VADVAPVHISAKSVSVQNL